MYAIMYVCDGCNGFSLYYCFETVQVYTKFFKITMIKRNISTFMKSYSPCVCYLYVLSYIQALHCRKSHFSTQYELHYITPNWLDAYACCFLKLEEGFKNCFSILLFYYHVQGTKYKIYSTPTLMLLTRPYIIESFISRAYGSVMVRLGPEWSITAAGPWNIHQVIITLCYICYICYILPFCAPDHNCCVQGT